MDVQSPPVTPAKSLPLHSRQMIAPVSRIQGLNPLSYVEKMIPSHINFSGTKLQASPQLTAFS
jgi:hypothetical protein